MRELWGLFLIALALEITFFVVDGYSKKMIRYRNVKLNVKILGFLDFA